MSVVWYRSMRVLGLGAALSLVAHTAVAQEADAPAPSPAAMVQQVVGTKPITITYSSPGVKNRVIWGELVPYGTVWRAGANAKTTIEFGEDVRVNGKSLKAGKYGFQVLPSETTWDLIFSTNTGEGVNASERDAANDALVITTTPAEAPFRERMAFSFDNMTDNSANVTLHWEKKAVSFEVKTGSGVPTFTGAQKEVFDVINGISEKLKAKDIEGTLTAYAEDFKSDQGGGKPEYKAFLDGANEQGFLDDMDIIMEDLAITVDGDKAEVKGMEAEGAFGVLTLEFSLEKREGKWMITYMAQY